MFKNRTVTGNVRHGTAVITIPQGGSLTSRNEPIVFRSFNTSIISNAIVICGTMTLTRQEWKGRRRFSFQGSHQGQLSIVHRSTTIIRSRSTSSLTSRNRRLITSFVTNQSHITIFIGLTFALTFLQGKGRFRPSTGIGHEYQSGGWCLMTIIPSVLTQSGTSVNGLFVLITMKTHQTPITITIVTTPSLTVLQGKGLGGYTLMTHQNQFIGL
mmetsp:Transcript_35339/g.73576  ORF Transcript_35339/g.73576 Transcript_35339/m.73576 type:complete len:213 (-) Transcript_35339:1395-2033(-)